jgi:hypothetical protein
MPVPGAVVPGAVVPGAVVPGAGVEPARPCGRRGLSPQRATPADWVWAGCEDMGKPFGAGRVPPGDDLIDALSPLGGHDDVADGAVGTGHAPGPATER